MDASGKTPSGILSGNTISMGDFDQCLAVKHLIASNNEFNGQYCQMELNVNISEIYRGSNIEIVSIESEQRGLPRFTQNSNKIAEM